MTYTLPELPYANNALAPSISRETIEYHYGKHERTYIDNLNRLIKDTPYEDMELEEIITTASGPLFNNASQAWNHIFYFFTFSPDGAHEPDGHLRKAIDEQFGSFDKDKDGKLFITQTSNAGNPLCEGLTPLLVFDVWEHAYYLDYRNRRLDALKEWWKIVDWDVVASRYL